MSLLTGVAGMCSLRANIGAYGRHCRFSPSTACVNGRRVTQRISCTGSKAGDIEGPVAVQEDESPETACTRALSQHDSQTANGHSKLGSTGQEVTLPKESTPPQENDKYGWLFFWVASAVAFGAAIWAVEGPVKSQEFFAGYILEQSLSVDNLFVFVLVFNYFKTPAGGQTQVLGYGIATAAVLRAILILAGVHLVSEFQAVLAVFAAILIYSSYNLLVNGEKGPNKDNLADNAVVNFCRRFVNATDSYDGNNFLTTLADGTRAATPLLLTLAIVEFSDVVFAVDSIPAVFGVTLDPFIVYTSNMFAILSLRALYQFTSTIMTKLRFLDKSVAVVLGFIGAKMLLDLCEVHVSTDASLLVVGMVLAAGVSASLLLPEASEPE